MNKTDRVNNVLSLLKKAYGRPRPFRRTDPVDEVVRTVLSQNTSDKNSIPAFEELKRRFESWEAVASAPVARIASAIRRAGLANIKAVRIRKLLRDIRGRRVIGSSGHWVKKRISLRWLEKIDADTAFSYLTSLKGIGPKTASCALLFSFAKPVMPVDTHIFRVSKRLGLIGPKVNIGEAHRLLTAMCGKNTRLIYELHLSIIEHGRRTCRAQNPRCGSCSLYGTCRYGNKRSDD
jgi:endonuclease-3